MAQPTKILNPSNKFVKPELENTSEVSYNKATIDTVSIRSLLDAKVKITGTVTGTEYIFNGAGALGINAQTGEEGIDIRDKDEILNKKRGRSCCGGQSGKSVFELV